MRTILLVALAVVFSSGNSHAGIVFRSQTSQATVSQGSAISFDVYISSDSGPVDVNYIEMRALAGDATGTGGLFTAASQVFPFIGGGNATFDLTGDPGFPGSAFNTNSGTSFSLDGEVRYAQLVLDTSASVLGTYNFSLDSLFAFDFIIPIEDSIEVPISDSNTVSYTIKAVPEPTAVGCVGLVLLVAGVRRRRRCRGSYD